MLQTFLVGIIHFIELPLASHSAVLNMSPKNACLYARSQGHAARTCCCGSIGCRFLCRGKVKFQKLFEEVSVSCCLLSTTGHCCPARAGSSPLSLGSLTQQSHWGRGTLPSVHVSPVSPAAGATIYCFWGCPKLRATARILHCYKHLRKAMKMNICNMITRLNLCWIPSP